MTTEYQVITIYKKRSDLLEFYAHNADTNQHSKREPYEKERDVRLILMSRGHGGRTFCKIKCPINPVPVKGEFEAPNFNVVDRFLKANGWTKCDTIPLAHFV